MFQTTNQHSFVSEMSEIHPSSSDKRENNGLKVQFHRWYLTEWWSLLEQKWRSKAYVHLSQPGTGNHGFFFIFLSFWLSFFSDWKLSLPPIPVKFFHYFFIPVFPPFGIFIFLSFASKMVLGPWELPPGAFSRTLFVSFHFISFLYCFGYVFSFALKIVLGNYQKEFFLEPFSFFFVFVSFWLWFLPLPWKLTLEIVKKRFSQTLFVVFPSFSVLAIFPPLPSKLTLEIVERVKRSFSRFFSFPFSFSLFFRFFCRFLFFHVRFHFRFFFVFLLSSFFVFRTWWQNVKGNRYEHDNINCTWGKHDKHFFHIIGEWKK